MTLATDEMYGRFCKHRMNEIFPDKIADIKMTDIRELTGEITFYFTIILK